MSSRKEQKERLEQLARAAAKVSATYDDFRTLMEQKGVYVVVSWSDDGKPFGVTWLDRATKCAWKGSETKADLKWLKDVAEQKGWTITRDKFQKVVDKRNRMPSRKAEPTKQMQPAAAQAETAQNIQQTRAAAVIAALKKIRAGGHHQDGDKDAGRSRGRSVWDEALDAAERDERERRKNEGENKL